MGTSTLKAGEYKLTWNEPGPDANVTFNQGRKKIAVVSATVTSKKNSDFWIFTATAGSGKVLQSMERKNATVMVDQVAAAGK